MAERRYENWTLDISTDGLGRTFVTLRELGKMDTFVEITRDQLPWFNALQNLLEEKRKVVND
jgi:hypothetical protein